MRSPWRARFSTVNWKGPNMAEAATTPEAPSASTTPSAPTGSEPAIAAAAPAAGAGGGEDAPWFATLDPALVKDRNVTKYESVEALARAHVAAIKRFGKDPAQLLEVPEKPDDKEGWGKLWGALGRPETIDGYGFKPIEGVADADNAAVGGFIEKAHGLGASKAVVDAAIETLIEVRTKGEEARLAAREAQTRTVTETLEAEWGDRFPVYKNEIGKLILDSGGEALVEELNELGLGNSVGLNRLLASLIDKRAEPETLPGGGGAPPGSDAMTPYQAQGKLAEIHGSAEKQAILLDKNHAQHKTLMEERERLFKVAYPGPRGAASGVKL
jgi:hypothetical protein